MQPSWRTRFELPPMAERPTLRVGEEEQTRSEPQLSKMERDVPGLDHEPLKTPGGSTMLQDGEPHINLQRLKERLELEIGLVSEGVRFLIFLLFCICFCASIFLHTRPVQRNASVYEIRETLGLAAATGVTTRAQVFDFVLQTSDNARNFFPLSSHYWDDSLSKAYVGEITSIESGPLLVPDDHKLSLTMSWSVTARLRLTDAADVTPPRRAIISETQEAGATDIICWALYCEGIDTYILLYGQHNMAIGYREVTIRFDPDLMAHLDTSDMNLVALNVNTTHFTVMLQDADSSNEELGYVAVRSAELPFGLMPSQCSGSKIRIGDVGLELAEVRYHPQVLEASQFEDVKEAGQTLENIAMGAAAPRVPDSMANEATSSTNTANEAQSQQVVSEAATTSGISRLVGSFVTGLWAQTPSFNKLDIEESPDQMALTGVAIEPTVGWSPSTGDVPSNASRVEYWPVLPGEATVWNTLMVGQVYSPNSFIQGNLTTAFLGLREQNEYSFTVTWWAKRDTTKESFVMDNSTVLGNINVTVDAIFLLQFDSVRTAWEITVGHSECPGSNPACAFMPKFTCKVDPMQKQMWRHMAITYGHGTLDNGRVSEVELFQDGVSLCGVSFPVSDFAMPHTLSKPANFKSWFIENLDHSEVDWNDAILRDIRLYRGMLDPRAIFHLAHDQEIIECMSLDANQNSVSYQTSFGQTCRDLSLLKHAGGLDAACMVDNAYSQCPVSCWDPAYHCWDGVYDIYRNPTLQFISTWEYQRDVQPPSVQRLNTRGQVWNALWGQVEKVETGTVISSVDGAPALEATTDGDRPLSTPDNLGCVQANYSSCEIDQTRGIDFETNLIDARAKLCSAKSAWETAQQQEGADPVLDNFAYISEDAPGFDVGLLDSRTNSYTIVMWAQSMDTKGIHAVSLTGVDSNDNVCFQIDGLQAVVLPADGAISCDFPAIELAGLSEQDMQRGQWAFFAISYDFEASRLTYMVNGVHEHYHMPNKMASDSASSDVLSGQAWNAPSDALYYGCSGLRHLINTGSEIVLSPPRVYGRALSVGSLQKLFIESQSTVSGLQGPLSSRRQRRTPTSLSRKSFNFDTFALSPPLVLQRRVNGTRTDGDIGADSSSLGGYCAQGGVFQRMQVGLQRMQAQRCMAPFRCDEGSRVEHLCSMPTGDIPDRFFGREALESGGSNMFPEFPWVLESSMLVRDGQDLNPRQQYIDLQTKEVKLHFSFYSLSQKIATILTVAFDMTAPRIDSYVTFLEVFVADADDFAAWLWWTVPAMLFIIIFMWRAMPAAIEEAKGLLRLAPGLRRRVSGIQKRISRAVTRASVTPFGAPPPKRYTADTTQPDMLDVLLSMALLLYLLFLTAHKSDTTTMATALGEMSETDWSDPNLTFQGKVQRFLLQLSDAISMAEKDERFVSGAFWLLVICAARMIIFMNIHPHISGIAKTFRVVGFELLNFMLSFGIIFTFLAFLAHIRFGHVYDEFSTMRASMTTQFAILIGDDMPDYTSDTMMCIYVIGYVFICTLALLNFLLAIVVNGYTKVSEAALENRVVKSLGEDMYRALADQVKWQLRAHQHKWPRKSEILNRMVDKYGDLLLLSEHDLNEERSAYPMSRSEFVQLLRRHSPPMVSGRQGRVVAASESVPSSPLACGRLSEADAAELFDHFYALECLRHSQSHDGSEQRAASGG